MVFTPLSVVRPVLLLVRVKVELTVMVDRDVFPVPLIAWFVEKVFAPVPLKEMLPLLIIPALNSKGAFPEDVKDPVPEMVGSPVNNFSPVAPEKARVPLTAEVVVTVNAAVLLLVIIIPAEMERF